MATLQKDIEEIAYDLFMNPPLSARPPDLSWGQIGAERQAQLREFLGVDVNQDNLPNFLCTYLPLHLFLLFQYSFLVILYCYLLAISFHKVIVIPLSLFVRYVKSGYYVLATDRGSSHASCPTMLDDSNDFNIK